MFIHFLCVETAHALHEALSKGLSMPQGVKLVDSGNTLVELRSNLTEPFARANAARVAVREDLDLLQALELDRHYHLGTVYREADG